MISPLESLSRRPIGNTSFNSGFFATFPLMSSSPSCGEWVITPIGLLYAKYKSFFEEVFPRISTLSPLFIFSPRSATRPFINTFPRVMSSSAARRVAMPSFARYLLMRIPSGTTRRRIGYLSESWPAILFISVLYTIVLTMYIFVVINSLRRTLRLLHIILTFQKGGVCEHP